MKIELNRIPELHAYRHALQQSVERINRGTLATDYLEGINICIEEFHRTTRLPENFHEQIVDDGLYECYVRIEDGVNIIECGEKVQVISIGNSYSFISRESTGEAFSIQTATLRHAITVRALRYIRDMLAEAEEITKVRKSDPFGMHGQ